MADEFDIRTLPSNFVSRSQPSKIIERVNERRRNAHNAAIECMDNKKNDVDVEIEEEIKRRLKELIEIIDDGKNDIEGFLLEIRNKDEKEIISDMVKFEDIANKLILTNELRKKPVDDFELYLAEVEKRRLDSYKLILNEAHEKMSQIYHKLPFELEEYFENEILKINQVSLNNFQKHVELHTELKLQIENDMRIWNQQLYEIKETVKIILKNIARKNLLKQKIKLRKALARERAEMIDKELSDYDSLEGEAGLPLDPSSPVVLKDVQRWIKGIRETLAAMDGTAKNLVHFYKETIVVLFNRFFEELETIKNDLISTGYVNKDDIEEFQREIYTPTAEELNLECLGDFQHLQNVWNNVISSMQETLDETYKCLKTANGLWENHFKRIEELQLLVLRNVKVAVQKNSISSEKTEVKLNVSLDTLRQAPTLQKLDKGLSDSKKTLDAIEKIYNSNCVAEMNLIKKYRVMMESEIDILMSEIDRFLTIYPPDQESDPKKQRKRASQTTLTDLDADEELIPPQMLFCQFQVDAIKNWMFGLWEALNQYKSFGREEILTVADVWINFQCQRVQKRLEVRLSFHSPRFERVKSIIYEARRHEITSHAIRFDMHKLAIEERVKSVKERQKTNEDRYNEVCNKFSETAKKYQKKILNSAYSYQVHRYKGDLKNICKETSEAIDAILNENAELCQKITDDLKTSNLKYMSVIKLFSEDGNYTAEEIKGLMKNLTKLEKATAKSLQAIAKEDKSKYGKYNTKVFSEDADVTSVMEQVAEEHKHNEIIVKQIKDLQGDVRYDVVSLRSDMKEVYVSFKGLILTSGDKLGVPSFLDQFSNGFQEVVTYLFDQSSFLAHPSPVAMYTRLNVEAGTSHSSQKKRDFADYTLFLFSVTPNLEENLFLTKLVGRLYTSLQEIQNNAKEFYTAHNCPLLDPSKLQPTYEDFMTEVLQKFKGFLIQCEICWAENASEFLSLLMDIIEFKADYLSRFEEKLQNSSRDRCRVVAEKVMAQLRGEREDMKRQYMETHAKLKTLHGHPNNKELLEALQSEFEELVKVVGEKLEEILDPCIDTLADEHESMMTVFIDTKEVLEVLNQDYGLSDLKAALSDQLSTKFQLMNDMIRDDQYEVSEDRKAKSEASSEPELPLSVSKQIVTYMRTVEHHLQGKSKTCVSFNSSLTATVEDFSTEMEETYDEDVRKITDFVNLELIQYHENFQKIWENEVKKILGLYAVKYDPKNAP